MRPEIVAAISTIPERGTQKPVAVKTTSATGACTGADGACATTAVEACANGTDAFAPSTAREPRSNADVATPDSVPISR